MSVPVLPETFSQFDPATRRMFLEQAARAMLGVTILPAAAFAADQKPAAKAAPAPKKEAAGSSKGPSALRVISLFMTGAMSHLDTFDVRANRGNQAETKPIQTKVPGLTIANWLPELAKVADQFSIVRSLHTETADHEQGRYLMRTSYKEIASIRHPALGAWIMKLHGKRNRTLPDNVVIGGDNRYPGAGFLEPSYTPVPIGDPNLGLQNVKQPAYLTSGSFETRMKLIDTFDNGFRKKFPQKQVEAYTEFYKQANGLIHSDDVKAFDLNQEKKEDREKYGMDRFGQGCLLARRLIEHDVRFVEVTLDGWDMHVDIYDKVEQKAGNLDRALSVLLTDLKQRGLLEKTLVVVATEFGRTPKVNPNDGRDHHPGVFSGVLAGGGIRGGVAYGTSDDDGHGPDDDPVRVADFNATIAQAVGLPLDKEIVSPSGRPFKVAASGRPITKLFG